MVGRRRAYTRRLSVRCRRDEFGGCPFAPDEERRVLVPMELARIVISEINDQQVVFLKEIDGDRSFPILIGIFEATSIDRRVQGRVTGELPPRPLTHDLLKQAIEELGGEAEDVVINNLMDHTYFALIRVRKAGELIELDARPSDAIALSVHYDPFLPIYVDDTVLAEVT
jgi:uncharacterized protein